MRLTTYCYIWPVSQAVKTPASHAGNEGSIPSRVTNRAKALKALTWIFKLNYHRLVLIIVSDYIQDMWH